MQEVFVDGYNLLRTDPELMMLERAGLEAAREALIVRLLNAAGLKSARTITVVFDGHKGGYAYERSEKRANGRLIIIYSKIGESADEVIKRMVAAKAGQANIRVITRDWEIKNSVSQSGASSGTMKRRPSVEQARQKLKAEEDGTVEGWSGSTRKKGPSKRPKKNERKPGPDGDIYW